MKYIQHHLVTVLIVAFIVVTGTVSAQKGRQVISFNTDWQFSNLEDFNTKQKGTPIVTGKQIGRAHVNSSHRSLSRMPSSA